MYTKHFNIGENTILTYDAEGEEDTHFTAHKLCKTSGFQVEAKEAKGIKNYYNTLLYSFYNLYGQRVKSVFVKFDFDNSTVSVNNHTLKVEESNEFVYKILKTKIKAIDGIKGFYKFILEAMAADAVFNCSGWTILAKIGNIESM